MRFGLERLGRTKTTVLMLICACLLALSLPGYGQNRNLTVVVLVNTQNASGYNPNPASPGEFQRFAERYLEHLQVPYEIFDVANAGPPADLGSRQLILAGHSRLLLSAAWRNAIATAVGNGTGYVNLDSDPNIGTESHIATIFGATGSAAGTPATQIVVPAAVAPGGPAAHYIAAFQTKFDGSPGAQTYDFHPDIAGVVRSSTSTVLLNASGTVIAQLGNDPLILATTHGSGRAVHFGTMEYLRADRFGFVMGVDDLFWRSLVWAARKPFVLRGYPRLWAVQIDDTRAGFGTRVRDMYDPAFTGATTGDGRGGPWKVTGYLFTDNMPPGAAERGLVVADINAGKLEVVPHSFADAPFGNIYWNPVNGPLTDAEWVTNMGLIDAWKQGNGGADTIPSFSRSLVGHFWHLSNNTGHDLWNRYGFRYVTSIIKPGFWARRYPDGAERIRARPFWNYEMPPKTFEAQYTSENYPFFFADDYPVGSRAGLPSQNFFLFTSQYLDIPRYVRLDYAWPTALSSPNDIPGSIAQLKQYTWRFWSGLSPVQLFTHDAGNYLNANLTERRTVITQSSAWMNANGVQHMFMDDLGDYIYARTKSTLTRAAFDGTQLTYTFTGNAATADGAAISTQLLLFQNDSEGAWQTVPGFSNGAQVTRDLPPSIQSVTPPNGVVSGGTAVTVSGSGFTPASSVFFGANSAASVTFVDSSTLQAVTPAATAVGSVDVRVVNVNGAAVLSAGFTYQLPPRVLVAAYSFNEGAGTVVPDLSGNGNNGTITGATWNAAGRYGQALSFTGAGNLVTVNDANSLDLTLGMTLEAWVRPSIGTGWRTVMFKEQPGNIVYGLYANTNTNQPSTNIFITTEQDTRGTSALPLNAWTHLAATYDGSTLRLFINGVEASNKALPGILPVSSGALRIGGNSVWGEYFNGLIDEIRIYNRASTAAEIQSDMNAPLGDNVPPSVSISAPASGATVSNTITVSATASDNLGVAGVQFFLDGQPLGSEDTVSPYSVSWNTATTANGSHTLTARARDGVGNSTTSAPVSVTTSNANPDPTPPTVSITSPANQATVSGQVTVAADASDNVGVVGVQFLLDGVSLGPEDTTAPYSFTWDSSTANNGFHTLTARARDAVGFQTTSSPITVTVTGGTSAGLMAAYGFSENTGTASADLSGNGNNASLVNGASWVPGKYGTGVNFDGVDDHASVPHSPSLTLGNTGTVEAWVKLNAISRWNGILAKGGANDAKVHNYALEVTNLNRFSCLIGSGTAFRNIISTTLAAAGQFYHLACTWDGTTIRLYLNGVLEASLAQNLTPGANTAPVTIGRFGGGADHLAGVIDDVRIYNRALNVSEIQSDMNTPAGGSAPPSDTIPPSVSVTSPANGATVSGLVTLTANASDNVGVTGVQFFVNSTAIQPEDTTAPYSVSWDSTTVANGGPYNITARARDAATNQTTSAVVPVSVNNAVADTTPPSVAVTAPANGDSVTGTVALTASASDNVGVAGVQFFVDGAPLGTEDTVAPYTVNWNTSTATAGVHTITASARDAATNQATSSPVTVSVGVFQDSVALSGFTNPSVVQFAADGRVFVAEKSGLIKVFDNLNDTTPTLFADLSTNVHNFWDRGLLGMALHPDFPNTPHLYVLYTHDAAIGGTAPRWGTAGVLSDPCPNPPGATADGCVVSGRLSKLVAEGNVMSGPEQVLIEDWCQQYPSHSIGSLAFGADGALYVSGGDGASFNFTDFGQDGSPVNPCGDPPGGTPGTVLTAPTAEGGALRSQDLRTAGDPVTLDGAILRLDPNTGLALSSNPLFGNSDVNARRIVAHGLRNPFRLTVRPGTSEVWAGDVGWNIWEEINRIPDPTAGVLNFGWPCYEALDRQSGYDGANLNICETLYNASGAVTTPYFSYRHDQKVVTGEPCGTGSSSISGLAFYTGGPYPSLYDGALFFADYSRDCIWVMFKGANGLPEPTNIATFVPGAPNPVDLKIGPQGDLFYLDFDAGTLRRIRFFTGNTPPTAVATANPTSGTTPLTVQFNGSASSDPDAGNTLTYDWDLTGDGVFGDSNLPQPSFTYSLAGSYSVRLRVTDNHGAFDTSAPIVINVNNTAPVATIATPSSATTWKVGDTINFSGSATDAEQGNLPPSALTWSIILHHCPSNCHTHPVQDIVGVASGSFTAPDHEYPSHIELRLTARDSGGLQDIKSVMLNPATVDLSFASEPSGLQITVGSQTSATPFTRTVIVNSSNSVSAVSPQVLSGTNYSFSSWSDGGAQTHNITAPQAPASFTATYTNAPAVPPGLRAAYGFSEGSGTTTADLSGNSNNGTLTNGPTWTTGKYGNGINFDGINDSVSVPHHTSLTLGNTGTIEAWVKLNTAGRWNAVLSKGIDKNNRNHNYGMEVSNQNRFLCVLGNGTTSRALFSTTLATAGQFYHVACTWDATTLRLYVNGILDASLAQNIVPAANTAPVRIGQFGGGIDSLAGVVDEFRIYDRALTASEIQSDMNLPINGTPPPPDSVPPTVSVTAPVDGATVSGITTLSADAADNVGVAGVQFFVNGNPIGSEDTTAPYSESWNTSSASNGGPYIITARARDLNNQTTSAPVSVTVNNTAPPPPTGGLVAAYGFDEGIGTVVSDSSGSGNHGTINGATWTGAGRFAQALSFNGSTHWVTVPDAASLDLTNGVTLGAWVKPAVATGWRTIVLKEQTAGIAYAMYANTSRNRPSAHIFITAEQNVEGPAALPVDTWTHVAMTFNGSVMRLYINGVEVSARALAGNMVVSTGALRIGGNSIWGEYFNGLIDEVKIYNRALTVDEIQGAMNTPVNAPPPTDTTPPTVTVIAPAGSATVGGQTTLYAEASDSSGIAGVQFYVDGSVFGSEITTAPFTIAWNTGGATNGSHSITAVARDFANNLATSAPVNITVANTNNPSLIGAWGAPFSWPIVAVNLVLTRTGELISWDGPPSNGGSSAQLWNPVTGVFTPVPNNLSNMFCDGAVVLQDGRVLAVGGHAASGVGIPNADIFDPITRQWTQAAPMTHGRWYPTTTLLPDGRVLTMSGSDTCYNCMVRVPEIYDPVTNQWTALPAIPASDPAFYYPQLFVLPDGRVLEAGATETSGPTTTRVMNVSTGAWTTVDPVSREGHSAVMYEPGKVMKSGATPDVGVSSAPAVSTTFVLDMTQPSPRWQQIPNMAYLRAFHVQTILPDGSVLATGGDSTRLGTDYATSVLAAELWSPVTKTWSTMAAQQNGRLYHSTAALLLDGRVLVTGSGRLGAPPQFNAEIYSPPYLFKGPRPAISSAPADVTYGSTFSVQTPDAVAISSVTMLRLSAVTHSLNMDQRFLRLNFSQGAGGLNVQAPANANLAPPGYYAIYILNSNGVPSPGAVVRIH